MTTILDKIVAQTRLTVAADQATLPPRELQARLADLQPTKDFYAALATTDAVRLIAEVKRASPSAGLIRQAFDPVKIAQAYQQAGAACLSVLTDKPFFQGDLKYLTQIRAAVDLPLLRKDFIIDPYQLLQARVAGADCVLLIAECLSQGQLQRLHDEAVELGLQTLIELYDAENLPAVLATGTHLIGVNNRDLRTFKTDLHHTLRIRHLITDAEMHDCILVGESGIVSHQDVLLLGQGGVKAVLVGESLMRQDDIGSAVRRLMTGAC